MSSLEEGEDNLASVHYKELLEVIARTLGKKDKLISVLSSSIVFDIDRIAQDVAIQFASNTSYPFENKDGTTYASTHFPDVAKKEAFSHQIEQVLREFQKILQASLGSRPFAEYARSLNRPRYRNLPVTPMIPKSGDSRYANHKQQNGDVSVELDALNP